MAELYPFLLEPYFSPRPWGGVDLSPIYPDRRFEEKIGESWLTGDECRIANGPLAGQTLSQVTNQYGRALIGEAAREERRFPLLLKFLFPQEKLSVQVHPDDECARKVGQPWGKTECWYVAAAKPGALGPNPRFHVADSRSRRFSLILQATDGAMAMAPQREIAVALFGRQRVEVDWSDPADHVRDRVRRAIRRGRSLVDRGYLDLLS